MLGAKARALKRNNFTQLAHARLVSCNALVAALSVFGASAREEAVVLDLLATSCTAISGVERGLRNCTHS
jgi:hypothetical protein